MRLTESLNQFSPEAFNTLISLLPGGSDGKEAACDAEDLGSIPGLGRPPGERKATHSMLAWRIPWTGEPGRAVQVAEVLEVAKSQTWLSK